jgi:hypothetical protein
MTPHRTFTVRILILALAVAIGVAWHQSGRSQPTTVLPQVAVRPAVIQWTRLASESNFVVSVAKVPGGWFVCTQHPGLGNNNTSGVSSGFFYPDPMHQWNGSTLP